MQEFFEGFSAEARKQYMQMGARFSSAAVIAQGRQTLASGKKHGAAIQDFGFGADDFERLRVAVERLVAAGGEREGLRTTGRESTKRRQAAMSSAKQARLQARTVLANVMGGLRESGNLEAVVAVEAVLSQTATLAGKNATELDGQLHVLANALAQQAVTAATGTRGGARVAAAVEAAVSELRTAMADPRRANVTHSETERVELLDGVVLELCRSARRAACAAAAALGQPAIAEDFELSALYGPRSSGGTPPAPSEPKA